MSVERAPAAELLARADDWLEQTRADGELRAGWSRPTDAVLVLGSAQRLTAPGASLRRSTGGGAVSCDDHYLMLDVVLPRGHPLVIDDVGQLLPLAGAGAAGGARGARRRAARRDAARGRRAARRRTRRGPARVLRRHGLVRARDRNDGRKLVGLAQRRRGGAALLQAAAYVAAAAARRGRLRSGCRATRRSACASACCASRRWTRSRPASPRRRPPARSCCRDGDDRAAPARAVQPAHDARRRARRHAAPARRRRRARVRDAGGTGARARRPARRRDAADRPRRARCAPARSTACASCSAVDDDIAPFLALAERDSLLAGPVARARGLRASRAGTCLHALVRALAGQLVTFARGAAHRARDRVPRRPRACGAHALARARRSRAPLGRRRVRLAAWRRAGRRRSCASRRCSTSSASRRRARRRGRGAAPAGAPARPVVGRDVLPARPRPLRPRPRRRPRPDPLCGALLGRRAEAEDTAQLLERYGEWAGLASLHLLRAAPAAVRQERAPRARTASA